MATHVGSMCSRALKGISHLNSLRIQTYFHPRHLRYMTTVPENAESKTESSDTKSTTDATTTESATQDLQMKLTEMEKTFATDKEALQKQISDFKDKYTRSIAEAENVRQRMQKQVSDAKLFGIQGFCKDLLEVADILQAATDAVPKDELTGENPHLKNLYEGLTMTELQLQKVFTRNGLNPINPGEGEKFNPHHHEALFQQPAPEGREGDTVAIVTKIGYMLHGRTIRPALVGVFKA